MYRTDKQFMKNPATAPQRIYIGGLPNTVVTDDLEQKFRLHGKILGIVLQRGFAFIQYETNEQAQTAINLEHGTVLHSKKIVVKHALGDRNARNNQNNAQNIARPLLNQTLNYEPPQNNQSFQNQSKTLMFNDQTQSASGTMILNKFNMPELNKPRPLLEIPYNNTEPPENLDPRCESPQYLEEKEMEMIAEKFKEEDEHHINFPPKPLSIVSSENFDDEDSRSQSNFKNRGSRNRNIPLNREERFPPHPPSFRTGNNPFYPAQERYIPAMERSERNDCEIIVVSKVLTEYAEYIESRLKSLDLMVDLLFPNENVPIGRVLANISSRGCLYAILITPTNKENQSLTLNILHGIPQEHRNMPLEDSFLFITRNFESYMRGKKTTNADDLDKLTIHDKHPNPMQLLINMLSENRILTSVQYDKLIKYLEERRELQVQFEVSEGIDVGAEHSISKQAELQNRIMNILNKSSENKVESNSTPAPPPPPPTSSSSSEPTPLLKDPSVQKALDSILLGDMFKNIASG